MDTTATEMTIPEIIRELTPYTGRFPMEAMRAAVAQKEAITPHLLQALEEVANAPEQFAKREDYMLHMFAMYLLAQFREKRAYPLLVKLAAAPGELPEDLLGDTVTEDLDNLLGTLYDGDPAPLQRLVEGDEVNEWVRGSAVGAFLVLANTGQMSREEVSRYFQSLIHGKLKRENNQAWNELASAIAGLPAPELLDDLRQAYEEGLLDLNMADFERVAKNAQTPADQKPDWHRQRIRLIEDASAEMEGWAAFHMEDESPEALPPKPREPDIREREVAVTESTAPIRHEPKIGRNDPCPCGSGKKYKKCCLGKTGEK